MRSIVRRVHPDLFSAHPRERSQNSESLMVGVQPCRDLCPNTLPIPFELLRIHHQANSDISVPLHWCAAAKQLRGQFNARTQHRRIESNILGDRRGLF